jgi:hypothetical protein
MKMIFNGLFGLLSIIVLVGSTPAHAFHLSLVGSGDSTTPSITGASTANGPLTGSGSFAFGGGALLGFHMGQVVELELGAIYAGRKFSETDGVNSRTYTGNAIHVPVVLRFWLGRFISLGGGVYGNVGTGDFTISDSTGVSATESYSGHLLGQLGLRSQDYGALGSLKINIPFSQMVALTLDGRYLYSLTNSVADTSTGATYKFNDIQVLAGLRFGFGSMK